MRYLGETFDLHSGREDNSRMIVEQLAAYFGANPRDVPRAVTLYLLPSVNPDGTARGIHTNARGVDLNRNWPSDDWTTDACHPASGCPPGLGGVAPLSEPETAALYNFIAALRPEVTIVWHAEAPLVEANEVAGADVYGKRFAEAAGYPYVEEWTAYRITGQLIDALEQRLGLRAFDVELSTCCAIAPEEFERNRRGVVAVLDEIADEVAERFGVERLAIVHRTGEVPLGEVSVAIVAVSPHRDAAFDAARYAIDETKARAPIWKAERFADGHVWIGEPARTGPAGTTEEGA